MSYTPPTLLGLPLPLSLNQIPPSNLLTMIPLFNSYCAEYEESLSTMPSPSLFRSTALVLPFAKRTVRAPGSGFTIGKGEDMHGYIRNQ
jgi:hypothetical protein